MSLILVARNISHLAPVSDYEVTVHINRHELFSGVVQNHERVKGAAELLRLIANAMDLQRVPGNDAGRTWLLDICQRAREALK